MFWRNSWVLRFMCVLTEVASRCNSLCEALFCSSLHPLFFNPAGSLSVLESLLGLRGFHPLLCLFSLLRFSSLPERKPGFYSLFSFLFPYFFCFTFFMTHLLCSISWLTFAFLFYFCPFFFFFSFTFLFGGSRGLIDRESDLKPKGHGFESQVRQEF